MQPLDLRDEFLSKHMRGTAVRLEFPILSLGMQALLSDHCAARVVRRSSSHVLRELGIRDAQEADCPVRCALPNGRVPDANSLLVMPACQAPGLRWRCRPNGSCHPPDWANPWGRVHRRSAATPNNNTPAIIGARQSPAQTRVANITKQTTAPSAGTAIGSSNAP